MKRQLSDYKLTKQEFDLLTWNTQLNNELFTLVAETQIASLAWAASIRVYLSNNDSDRIEKLKYFHVYEHTFDKFLV